MEKLVNMAKRGDTEAGMAAFSDASVTDAGVTVTAQ